MLAQAGSSIDGDEALLQVIGFLEACVPRMVELIEAAAQGALKPETFEECLVVNDKLANILSDVDKDPKDRQPIILSAAASAAVGDSEVDHVEEDLDNKLAIGGSASPPLAVAAGGKTTGLDDVKDPFSGGVDLLSPTPLSSDPFSTTSTAAAAPTTNDDDDFDAFFRDRTSAGGGKQD